MDRNVDWAWNDKSIWEDSPWEWRSGKEVASQFTREREPELADAGVRVVYNEKDRVFRVKRGREVLWATKNASSVSAFLAGYVIGTRPPYYTVRAYRGKTWLVTTTRVTRPEIEPLKDRLREKDGATRFVVKRENE